MNSNPVVSLLDRLKNCFSKAASGRRQPKGFGQIGKNLRMRKDLFSHNPCSSTLEMSDLSLGIQVVEAIVRGSGDSKLVVGDVELVPKGVEV